MKWLSRLYRNGGNLFFAPPRFDWGEQIVVVTGGTFLDIRVLSGLRTFAGASGIGELIANTLAVRNVSVVVLDVNPIVTENCMCELQSSFITFKSATACNR